MNTNDPVMWIDHWITIQFTTPFPGVKMVNHDAENDDARRDLPGR